MTSKLTVDEIDLGTGGLGSEGNIVLDDGTGDSPQIQLVGGSNDDTGYIFLDDDAVAGRSDLIIKLPGSDNQSILDIQDSAGTTVVNVNCDGNMNVYAVGGIPGTFCSATALTDAAIEVWRLIHTTSGTPAAGFGDRLDFFADNDNNMAVAAAAIDAIWDDPAAGSEDSRIAFNVRVGGAALAEICRIDGDGITMAAGKDITMPDDTWIGLGSSAGRIVFDNQTPDEIEIMNANVGIGVSPGAGYHLRVEDTAVETTIDYCGLSAAHTKTAGASDHDDDLIGADLSIALNQNGGEIGDVMGVRGTATLTDGSIGDAVNVKSLFGGKFHAGADGGTVTGNVTGFYCPAAIGGATVDGNVYGFYAFADLNSGSVGGNAYGGLIAVNDDIGATTVYGLFLYELTGVDYGFYQYAGEPPAAPNVLGGRLSVGTQKPTDDVQPVLILDQNDVDQPFIEFLSGTVYTSKTAQDAYLMVKDPNGNTRYLRLYA